MIKGQCRDCRYFDAERLGYCSYWGSYPLLTGCSKYEQATLPPITLQIAEVLIYGDPEGLASTFFAWFVPQEQAVEALAVLLVKTGAYERPDLPGGERSIDRAICIHWMLSMLEKHTAAGWQRACRRFVIDTDPLGPEHIFTLDSDDEAET